MVCNPQLISVQTDNSYVDVHFTAAVYDWNTSAQKREATYMISPITLSGFNGGGDVLASLLSIGLALWPFGAFFCDL